MLALLIGILGIILTILLVVGIHEFGHFIVAQWVGVKVLRFSIGFGKTLFSKKGKSGTEYVIAAIPLGGYVKLLDENEAPVPQSELPFAFNRQPIYKKFLIVIAGPLFNFIFAFLLYWLLFMVGFTTIVPIIGKLQPQSIAANAGLKSGEEIIKIENETTRSWFAVVMNLISHLGDKKEIHLVTVKPNTENFSTYQLDLKNWKVNDLKPDPLQSLGIEPYEPTVPPVIGNVLSNSPALGKLQVGDKILFFNKTPIKDWIGFATELGNHPDEIVNLTVKRNEKILIIPVKIGYGRDVFFKKYGILGVSADFKWPANLLRLNQYGPIESLFYAWKDAKDFTYLNFLVFVKLITGKLSFASLGGPITIFESAGSAINHGMIPFLSFLAFLSIGIGFINVLPIPGLDGGHILFQFIEVITRRPVPLRVQALFYRLGFILLMVLIVQALVNDILRFTDVIPRSF